MCSSGSPAPAYVRRGACCVRPLDAESDASSPRPQASGPPLGGTCPGRYGVGRRRGDACARSSEAAETWAIWTIRSTPDEPAHKALNMRPSKYVAGGLVRKARRRMFAAEADKRGRVGPEKPRLTALAPSGAFPCQEYTVEILGLMGGTGQVVASEEERTLAHARWQTNSTLSCAAEPSNLGFGFVPCVRCQWPADTRHKELMSALGVGRCA